MDKEAAIREVELHQNLIGVAKTAQAVIEYTQGQRKQASAHTETIVSLAKKAGLIDDATEGNLRSQLDSHAGSVNVTRRLLEEIVSGGVAKRAAAQAGAETQTRRNGYPVSQDKAASVQTGSGDYLTELAQRNR